MEGPFIAWLQFQVSRSPLDVVKLDLVFVLIVIYAWKNLYRYPPEWTATKKQIKTHVSEVLVVKDGTSAQVGLVVDPVKINSLKEFGSPEQVADKVLGVEKKKDGTLR